MPVNIFVSHSTKLQGKPSGSVAKDDGKFLRNICERLNQSKQNGKKLFHALVDYDELHAGDHWREKLLRGLGDCSGGVVLLNKHAIETSEWVHTEASILRWRRWLQEDFPLMLVYLGKGTKKAFDKEAKWRPLSFSEVQFLGGGKEFQGAKLPNDAFDELVAQLKKAVAHEDKPPYERFRDAIQLKLEAVFKGDQKRASQEAEQLLRQGPAGVAEFLERCSLLIAPEALESIIEYIAPWWIDPRSSCRIAKARRLKQPTRAFSLTGKQVSYTPKMYVRQASVQVDYAWKIAVVSASGGQQKGKALCTAVVGEVRKRLIQAYRKVWDNPDNVSDQEISEQVERMNQAKRPTFVALPNHVAGDAQVSNAVLKAFKGVTLLHLAEDEQLARNIPACEVLDPLPTLAEEASAYDFYKEARGVLP